MTKSAMISILLCAAVLVAAMFFWRLDETTLFKRYCRRDPQGDCGD